MVFLGVRDSCLLVCCSAYITDESWDLTSRRKCWSHNESHNPSLRIHILVTSQVQYQLPREAFPLGKDSKCPLQAYMGRISQEFFQRSCRHLSGSFCNKEKNTRSLQGPLEGESEFKRTWMDLKCPCGLPAAVGAQVVHGWNGVGRSSVLQGLIGPTGQASWSVPVNDW